MAINETEKTNVKVAEREIIDTIIEEISEKHFFSDSEIQEYEKKITNYLDKLVQEFDRNDEFDLNIISNPHEYARKIKTRKDDIVIYKGRECEVYELHKKNIIGDAKIKEVYAGMQKSDFSLSDLQIRVIQRTIYNGYLRAFDFKRTQKAKGVYKILVYIPKEREEKENSVKTYQELVYQEIEDKIRENEQETIQQIMSEIESNCELTDSLYEEYRKKLQQAIKLGNSDIEKVQKHSWNYENNNIKVITKRNPTEYVKYIEEFIQDEHRDYEEIQFDTIIGDFNGKEMDFSIGNIQICIRNRTEYNGLDREVLLYIPERELFEEKSKKGIVTYKDLVNGDKEENQMRVERVARITRDSLEKRLQTETNKYLTKEQIETILNSIDFVDFIHYCDLLRERYGCDSGYDYKYALNIIKDPDKFSENIGKSIIGDISKRNLL